MQCGRFQAVGQPLQALPGPFACACTCLWLRLRPTSPTPHALGSCAMLDSAHHGLIVPLPVSPHCPLSLGHRRPIALLQHLEGKERAKIWGETCLPPGHTVTLWDAGHCCWSLSCRWAHVHHPEWLWGRTNCGNRMETVSAKPCLFFPPILHIYPIHLWVLDAFFVLI